MLFTNRINTITLDTIVPKIYDQILNDNFITYRFIGNGKRGSWSGRILTIPIKTSTNPQVKSFQGMDQFGTNQVETRQLLTYDPRGVQASVAISGMEQSTNAVSESQIIDLLRAEMESTKDDMMDAIGGMFYANGTGNLNKDYLGMDVLNDDGTSSDLIGQLSRSANPVLKGYRVAATSGLLNLNLLGTSYDNVAGGNAMLQQPTLFQSSEVEWTLFEQLLSPTVRENYNAQGGLVVTRNSRGPMPRNSLTAMMGYTCLAWRGVPWIKDEKAPVGTTWIQNENYTEWRSLRGVGLQQIALGAQVIEGVYNDAPSNNTGLQWTGLRDSYNQYGSAGYFILMGNMITTQPRRLGRITSITGI
jgi:hypothetical protein